MKQNKPIKTSATQTHKRVLAKPLTKAGKDYAPGETVELRTDQIERFGESFFEPIAGSKQQTAEEAK